MPRADMPARSPAIHALPAETISHIFRYLVRQELDSIPEHHEKLPPALILRSVCRRWYAVVLDTTELWVELVGPYGIEWTRQALALSKNLPLDLKIGSGQTSWQSREIKDVSHFLLLLKGEKHRIRDLKVDCYARPYDLEREIIRALFTAPLPALESLNLRHIKHTLDESLPSGATPPQLKELILYSCTMTVKCVLLHAPLTTLDVIDSPIWTSTDELLDTLSHLPQLEVFHWGVMLTTYNQHNRPSFNPLPISAALYPTRTLIHLPHLQSLDMLTQAEYIAHIMAHIVFPTSCEISAKLDLANVSRAASIDEFCVVLDLVFGRRLRAAFPDDDGPSGFQIMKLDCFIEDLTAGVTVEWSEPISPSGPQWFTIGFLPFLGGEDEYVRAESMAILRHILTHWPSTVHGVTRLISEHNGFYTAPEAGVSIEDQPWTQLLGYVPTLESIYIKHDIQGLPDALMYHAANLTLPHLRRLDVGRLEFTLDQWTGLMTSIKMISGVEHVPRQDSDRSLALLLEDCQLGGVEMPTLATLETDD